ncbi:hypothetical protein [Actinocorallia longicatena]|uniref:Uncharacterized protein n=1 Tax=Actinocorallia longicatena TaxID=111803 RepID=A0ABP6QD09_9ACTN
MTTVGSRSDPDRLGRLIGACVDAEVADLNLSPAFLACLTSIPSRLSAGEKTIFRLLRRRHAR